MTALSHLQSRRVLVVADQGDQFFSYWINSLQSPGFDVHVFPLDASWPSPDLNNLTIHRLFVPLRPRLMLRILMQKPDQLLQHFPNYEFHLQRRYHTEFVYPLFHIELSGHPASPISALLRKTGSMTDVRPAALARVIERVRPDLVVSIGLDHAAAVTLRARARLGPGFPAWLLCTRRERTFAPGAKHPHEISQIFSSVDFFAYEREAELLAAGKLGLNGPALPFSLPTKFDFEQLAHKMPLPPSKRRTIVIDCCPDRAESAVAAIEALESCAELLQNYMTVVCGPSHKLLDTAATRVIRTGRFPIMRERQVSMRCPPELVGSSRLYMGAAHLPDEADLALVYAAAMGAFAIRICDPDRPYLPDPSLDVLSVASTDVQGLKSAITRALTDGDLVDRAATKNLAVANRKYSINSPDAIDQRRELFDEIFVGPRAVRARGRISPAAG